MEKIAKFLGAEKGIHEAMKNIFFLVLSAVAVSFTAGTYFGNAKDLPGKVATIERRQDIMETDVKAQLGSILQKLESQNQDMRDLRSAIMDGRRYK